MNKTAQIEAPKRISNWENRKHKGLPCAGEPLYSKEIAEIEALRERQREYTAALPMEARDANHAALRILNQVDDYDEGLGAAVHLIHAIEVIGLSGLLSEREDLSETVAYLASRAFVVVEGRIEHVENATDILRRPIEIEREANNG